MEIELRGKLLEVGHISRVFKAEESSTFARVSVERQGYEVYLEIPVTVEQARALGSMLYKQVKLSVRIAAID